MRRLLADQIAVDADQIDYEQDDILGAYPLPFVVEKTPGDQRQRRSDENHERPAGRPAAEIERNDQGGKRPGGRAIPLQDVQQGFAHAFSLVSSGRLAASLVDGKWRSVE